MRKVSRQTAIVKGLSKYFTGRPCMHGHVAERYTLGSSCVQCLRESTDRARAGIKSAREKVEATQ